MGCQGWAPPGPAVEARAGALQPREAGEGQAAGHLRERMAAADPVREQGEEALLEAGREEEPREVVPAELEQVAMARGDPAAEEAEAVLPAEAGTKAAMVA